MQFTDFDFAPELLSGIRAAGYDTPTPIQRQAMPLVQAGHDVMGLAQTGTGKTAAFALPCLQRLIESNASRRGPARVLVLAPTRELALQIHETFITLGRQTGIRSAAVFGGVGMAPQVKAARSATVIVACPGRLLALVNQGDISLRNIDTLILDEADRMLDMGFLPDIRRVLAALPSKRQNLLFSATMPRDIRDLSEKILRNPKTVQVSNTAPAASISHTLYPVPQHLKNSLLESLLKTTPHDSVLIFTRTKHRAKILAQKLERRGHTATFLQGNLSQSRRQKALDGFRDGTYSVMVATDIAARGIDCDRISHVINFDVPDTAETYTHRIGRTGRAGRTGEALTLVTDDDRDMVRAIERTLGGKLTRSSVDSFDYKAPDNRSTIGGGRSRAGQRDGGGSGSGRTDNRPSRGSGRGGRRQETSGGDRRDGGRSAAGSGRKEAGAGPERGKAPKRRDDSARKDRTGELPGSGRGRSGKPRRRRPEA